MKGIPDAYKAELVTWIEMRSSTRNNPLDTGSVLCGGDYACVGIQKVTLGTELEIGVDSHTSV